MRLNTLSLQMVLLMMLLDVKLSVALFLLILLTAKSSQCVRLTSIMATTFVSTMITPPTPICTSQLSLVVQCPAFSLHNISKAALLWMAEPSGTSTSTQRSNNALKKSVQSRKLHSTYLFAPLQLSLTHPPQRAHFKTL